MEQEKNKKYGLLTAITMIVGICIGSGIFFKSDNILVATNGSVFLGVVLFCLAAIAIVFGSLTIGELATRTDKAGGIISYAEAFINQKTACGFGWFQTFIYFPTITVVVSWVVGVYVDILFALNASLEMQLLIGFVFLTVCFLYNVLSPRFGSLFQNVSTLIKLIPLFLLGILGVIYGNPVEGFAQTSPATMLGVSWLVALGPIAYSYDGWVVSASIAHEVKDAKKTMPKAYMIAPLIVLAIYTLYFVGISSYIGPEEIIRLGDDHVKVAAQQLLGNSFANFIVVFVIVSVMGTVNGLVLGFIRMPYSLAMREGMIPLEKHLKRIHPRYEMPVGSALFAYVICIVWYIVHYVFMKYALLANSDVSEIAIAIAYFFYMVLYFQVFQLYRQKQIKSVFRGVVCPLFATIGSLIILSGGFQNPLFIYYILFCGFVFLASQIYYQRQQANN